MSNEQSLSIVIDDLRYIEKEWGDSVDNNTLRRGSVFLRRLLNDGHLQQAWRYAGFKSEPQIIAPDLDMVLRMPYAGTIIRGIAGGGTYEGITTGIALVCDGEGFDDSKIPTAFEIVFGLRGFVNSTCVYVERRKIKRGHIIKYVCNKLGGAHYDLSRKLDKPGDYERILDANQDALKIDDKNAVYFGLLSIGQRLVKSPDIQKLMAIQ